MKTSKGNVRCRFGRLLSGILSAAMLFSAAAFQIPVSADEEVGEYEVLYDFIKDTYQTNGDTYKAISDNGTDTINAGATSVNMSVFSNRFQNKISGKTVRFHFEIMHEYDTGYPIFQAIVTEAQDENEFDASGYKWVGLTEDKDESGTYKIGYYGDRNYQNLTFTEQPTFEKDRWYSVDTIYDLANSKASYYIDGEKIGESTGPTEIIQAGLIILNSKNNVYGVSHLKNMKLDTGVAAQITDTNDNGAVLEFTRPIEDFDASYVTVKCLETGDTPTVTVTKVNNMKYKINYSTGTNIGGDYTLTLKDAFATVNGISEKTVVYSQKPSISYGYYINDDFESYTVEGEADSRNAEGSTFWTKNTSVSTDTIAQDGGSGVAGNSTYAVTDNGNKMLKLDGSVVPDRSRASEVGFKYALSGYKTGDNNWNTNTDAAKGKIQIKFDVKNVAQPNEGVTATTPPVFTLATNPYYTKILGITKDTLYIYSKADGTLFDVMPSEDQIHTLASTPTGFHSVEISLDFDKNTQTISVDGTQYHTGKMYTNFNSNGLSWLRFIQLKHSKATEDKTVDNVWSNEDYGSAYTLIDKLKVTNLDSVSMTGIKSVQYSTDNVNYSPAVDKVDSATKYVKIDFTEAMSAETLGNIKLMQGSTAVDATGAASPDNKTYTLTLTDNLATSADYTLNIPTSVKTSSGNSLARAYAGKITTTAGTFKIDLLDIQKNGTTVAKSNIEKDDILNAVVNITNTEGREGEAYLCICVYNDDVMTQVNFDKINLKTESTKSVPITVASTANIKVKAFLWNDFATMKPLIQNKTVE